MLMDAQVPLATPGPARTFSQRWARWDACLTDAEAERVGRLNVGRPADPNLNLDAACLPCLPLEFADPMNGGQCTPCPAGSVPRGTQCQACPSGEAPRANNECTPCEANEIVVAGACVPCAFGQGADSTGQMCVDCDLDDTLDFGAGTSACSPHPTATLQSAMGDDCPDVFVVDIENFDPPSGEFGFVTVFPEGEPAEAACQTVVSRISGALPDGMGGFFPPSEISTPGFYFDTCPEPSEAPCSQDTEECLICDRNCLAAATVAASGMDLAALGNTMRITAQVSAGGAPIPGVIRLSESNGGFGLCRAR